MTLITLIERTLTIPALRQVYDNCGLEGLRRLLRTTLPCPRCTPSAPDGFPAQKGRLEYPQLELIFSYGIYGTSRFPCIRTAGFVWWDLFICSPDAPPPFLLSLVYPWQGLSCVVSSILRQRFFSSWSGSVSDNAYLWFQFSSCCCEYSQPWCLQTATFFNCSSWTPFSTTLCPIPLENCPISTKESSPSQQKQGKFQNRSLA